jgi:catechol 2,3-dioxygenase-like lactoylglutathione lyase family enzyme
MGTKRQGGSVSEWPGSISAISLFVGDLDASRTFYQRVFGLPVHFADADSVVFRLGDTLINLLIERAVPEVIAPASLAPPGAGAQFQFTVNVDDVDGTCATLTGRGVELLNGPMDRPWGIRTASFEDPDGYIWEIASS